MSRMNAGQRDREVTIQTATTTQDAETGEQLIDWDDIDEQVEMAQWFDGNTRETFYAQQRLAAHIEGIFRVAYIARPNPATQRIVDEDGRVFDIKPPVEVGRREGWDIPVVARGE
jgi:head-tail adaptor